MLCGSCYLAGLSLSVTLSGIQVKSRELRDKGGQSRCLWEGIHNVVASAPNSLVAFYDLAGRFRIRSFARAMAT